MKFSVQILQDAEHNQNFSVMFSYSLSVREDSSLLIMLVAS